MKRAICVVFVAGCVTPESSSSLDLAVSEQATTACANGPMVKGIDVSYHQMAVDWTKVKAAGIEFAFIRVSDGSTFQDPQFATYWADSRAAGVRHGAYQLFRPAEDALAQANLLLSKIGSKLEPDDLPPSLDVEVTGSQTPAQIQAKLQIWIDRVRDVLGRDPIIYTTRSFWQTNGSDAFASSPLWALDVNPVTCPNIADAWPSWRFWQHSWTGRIDGITVDVDLDNYNGDLTSLQEFLGPPSTCGDGACGSGETDVTCPGDCFMPPSGPIGPEGGVIDDGDPSFEVGGSLNRETTAGNAGDMMWAPTTASKSETNFGVWHLDFQEAGRYRVEVYTDSAFAQSKHAKYIVRPGSGKSVGRIIDQTAVNGWQSLGEYNFAAGGDQSIHAGDNTGEKDMQLAFDAVRLTRVPDAGDPGDDGDSPHGNCSAAGGGTSAIWLLALAGVLRKRRRG